MFKYKNCIKNFERQPDWIEVPKKNIVYQQSDYSVVRVSEGRGFPGADTYHLVKGDLCVYSSERKSIVGWQLVIEDIWNRDVGRSSAIKRAVEILLYETGDPFWANHNL
ncbi:hypothetical protein [Microbulbifer epialgicus]|uniref:Uncharacterized protein n=1 Tax=Microbulbifer epialgicus TaxID=393907 RepID=A0ABV4NTP1_9GAMM